MDLSTLHHMKPSELRRLSGRAPLGGETEDYAGITLDQAEAIIMGDADRMGRERGGYKLTSLLRALKGRGSQHVILSGRYQSLAGFGATLSDAKLERVFPEHCKIVVRVRLGSRPTASPKP